MSREEASQECLGARRRIESTKDGCNYIHGCIDRRRLPFLRLAALPSRHLVLIDTGGRVQDPEEGRLSSLMLNSRLGDNVNTPLTHKSVERIYTIMDVEEVG